MASLSLSSVSLIADRPLVSDLSFTLSSGERLGLIAINGGGKSTLLRCLAGEAEPSEGEIVRSRGASVALVPQEVPEKLLALPFAEVLRRAIAPERREDDSWRVDLALEEFQVPEEFRQKPMGELSGGWQRLALIARVWLTDPDFLLLDEPTNHLDLEKMTLLEDWLNGSARGVGLIVASHDRQFLDNCTEKTLFLRPEASRLYSHSFSKARELLAEDDEAHAVKLAKDQREVEKMLDQWRKLKNIGINSGSDYLQKRAAQMKNRADELEETLKERQIEKSADIRLANRGTHAKVLMTLENVRVTTPDARPLFAVEKLYLRQGDRLVLLGANGVGKSQLVKLVLSALRGQEVPGLKFSPSVVPGYLDQLMSHLPAMQTPFDFIAGLFRLGDQPSVKALAGAGFSPLLQGRRIEQLSPGQKARLGLLAIRLTDPNLYLMDEPTNHVDIAGQERLEEEIIGRGATAILVSHDRRFVERVGTRFLLIERGKAREVDN